MDKRWILNNDSDFESVERLSKELNINKKLVSLLFSRGVTTYDEAKQFFRPKLEHLHDPFLMKDMDKAVDRVLLAVEKGEKIMVYGDYDVDGTTAVSLVYSFIKSFYKNIEFYIPDRYNEGYGISFKGIDYAHSVGSKLMIALDCGIKAVDKVKYAKEKGIEFIICDHHRPGETIPDAVAVLDAKQEDCNYPFKELSGCGVGFKLAQAIASKNNIPENKVFSFIDLVVVSIAADIVPMVGENRVLAYYGLKKINNDPSNGICSILKSAGVLPSQDEASKYYFSKEITINDLVFSLGPRINAAGRIENATNSVRLLISTNTEYAEKLGAQINELNSTRRDLDTNITKEAIEQIENNAENANKKATIVYNPQWHKGVIGIVASRLIERFYKPTLVFTKSGDLITGSARSIKGFDIYDAIDNSSDILEHFGGHTYAAGLALKPEKLEVFKAEFQKYADENLKEEYLTPEISIDEELDVSDVNIKFYKILKQFAPFGPGNMSPVFVSNNVIDTGYAKIVGKNGQKHLKFSVVQTTKRGAPLSAIGFNLGHHYDKIKQANPFSICYHIEENTWQGRTSLQLRILDIKFPDPDQEEAYF
ncbi:MAG: single-stranded-DNA-specific exonuclease RecJ [Marinilabiliales bacterium]|nr:MAG: single-stranded-DNA-specific exonuclease RecJ [Marinilabiliales bacterium]